MSGPFVTEERESAILDQGSLAGTHAYFEALSARPDCEVAYGLRNQAELDGIQTAGRDGTRHEVIYDPVQDAMLQRAKGDKAQNVQQKIPRIDIRGTSMLLTFDFKVGTGAIWKGEGYLQQYKAFRVDGGGDHWLSLKLNYKRGVTREQGVAELSFHRQGKTFLGPGTTNVNSEILEPRLTEFYPQVNTWTRVWIFLDGVIGGPNPVFMSVWAADEQRAPIRLYDRLQMFTPQALSGFLFEYNTSEPGDRLNPLIEHWGRNYVVLKGLTSAAVAPLLTKPLK